MENDRTAEMKEQERQQIYELGSDLTKGKDGRIYTLTIIGQVETYGNSPMMVDGVPVSAEPVDDVHFMLEIGEMPLPWMLDEDPDEVISPANEPEFLEKMYLKMLKRNAYSGFLSS